MPEKLARYSIAAIAWCLALGVAAFALLTFWQSRYQAIEWDLAMMHYIAWLINEKGFILYRDVFENNFPGAFLFQSLLGKFFGYDALPLRVVDFFILAGIGVFSWKILAPLSRPAAIFCPAMFAVIYLSNGSYVFLQRDYIAILPVLIASAHLLSKKTCRLRDFILAGALCGFSCGFKPNVIVAFPALFLVAATRYSVASTTGSGFFRLYTKPFLSMSLAFTAVFSIPFIWGIWHCDYAQLVYIYKTFTPIYLNSRIDLFQYANSEEHMRALLDSQLHQFRNTAMSCLPGLGWAWFVNAGNIDNRKRIRDIAIIIFAFSWYELMAGKYWFAHLLPTYFWNTLGFSLLLSLPARFSTIGKKAGAASTVFIAAGLSIYLCNFLYLITPHDKYSSSNSHIRSQKIGAYLKQHLQPGDTVQGIDGSGDGQGSLLIARATPATRYLEDIPLYMQPDAPATQAFRQEFLSTLAQKPPAYIVYIENFFHPAGGNRLAEFRQLNSFVQENYEKAEVDDGQYIIYKRKYATASKPQ
ncbi:MAG TPA: hypothetical protein PLF22_00330 [Pseudomonadales bacterium]|nr:hypothetical protein [Pseudomonadales bacterium]